MFRNRRWQTLIVSFILLTITFTSQAHGYIVRSIPEDRITLNRPPTRLQYWFSEDLEPRFSEINLRDQTGTVLATGGVDSQNQTLLSLQVPPNLPDGAYIVDLRPAFSSDGHVVAESRVFFVGEEIGGVEGAIRRYQRDSTGSPLACLDDKRDFPLLWDSDACMPMCLYLHGAVTNSHRVYCHPAS